MGNELRPEILYSKAGGHYFPAFFKIGILNGADITKIDNWDDTTSALFYHEYIHFLQDISTVYGLNNIIRIGEVIQEAITGIKNGSESFEVPFSFSDGNIDTRDISIVLTGDRQEINEVFAIEKVEVLEKFFVNSSERYHVPKVVILADNERQINFGSHAIAEGMAYIAEQYIANNNLPAAEYPYKMVTKVADFLCPGLNSDILNVYVLCDLSLMHSEPGAAFVKYLKRIHLENVSFNKPEDIYEFFEDEYFIINDHLDQFKQKKMKRTDLYLNLASRAMFYISGYFQHIPGHPNIAYLMRQMEVVTGYRLHDPLFMVKILKDKTFQNNRELGKLISLLGSPFLVDVDGKSSFLPPRDLDVLAEMEKPWLMMQFLSDISSKNSICKALTFCQYNESRLDEFFVTDGDCYDNPWRRAQKDLNCPYARLLDLWGVRGKTRKVD